MRFLSQCKRKARKRASDWKHWILRLPREQGREGEHSAEKIEIFLKIVFQENGGNGRYSKKNGDSKFLN
jgi:hypothetical protein